MRSKRVGRFAISRPLIEDDEAAVRRVMAQCVIVGAVMNYVKDAIEYDALSPQFDEIEEGEVIPWYEAIISGPTVKFRRIDGDAVRRGELRERLMSYRLREG